MNRAGIIVATLFMAVTACGSGNRGPASPVTSDGGGDASVGTSDGVDAAVSGAEACQAAGGTCIPGPPSNCRSGNLGPPNCDPGPSGSVCCLPAATGAAGPLSLYLTPPALTGSARPPPEQQLLDDEAARAEALEPARCLERYFAQPFFVAERLIGQAATDIPIGEVIQTCQRILNGEPSPADMASALTGVRTIEGSRPQWVTLSLSKETYAEPTQSVRLVYQVPKK